ncbi:hypothetical protein B0H11DRAFT_2020883 [Mycena galericulata]|nr:hypothetical protein B0H11DRAFT_2020883 [Mycena galericulata]
MTQPGQPDGRYIGCLPVFYANLDPAGIPTSDWEHLLEGHESAERALLAITALNAFPDLPPECGMDLWPRFWAWTTCLYDNRDYLGLAATEDALCFGLLHFIDQLSTDDTVALLIEQTVGVRTLVTRAWSLLLQRGKKQDHPCYPSLCNFMCRMKASDRSNFEEILGGAGGLYSLAQIIVGYITLFVPTRNARLSVEILHFLDGPFELLADLDDADGPINRTLLSAGIVPALTTVACAIGEARLPRTIHLLLAILATLQSMFIPAPSYRAISQALSHGLLRAIVRCASMGAEADNRTSMWYFLDVTLPTATLYYAVAAQLQGAIKDIIDLVETASFKRLAIWNIWQPFFVLAHERIALLRNLESKKVVYFKACDNMECGKIAKKIEFRRCSQCQSVYYCSISCQKHDWTMGDHRTRCSAIRTFARAHPEYASPRNLSFMRAVIHQDAQTPRWRANALRDRLRLLRGSAPGSEEHHVTVFTYLSGKPYVHAERLRDSRSRDQYGDVDWDAEVARAARSGGRMELHLVRFWDGDREHLRMLTMRCNIPVWTVSLRRLARETPSGDSRDEIEGLMDTAVKGLVEIHP